LKNGLRVYNGTHKALPEVQSQGCRSVRALPLGDEEVLIELDGEQSGRLPATFEILPRAIDLLV
jgi:diacylglycerol kinase (ATP)